MDETETVGQIATTHPAATRVFHRHGIDYCCGGRSVLKTACAERGLDPEGVLGEIRAEEVNWAGDSDLQSWSLSALDELIEHVVADYHVPLREELPRLEQLVRKVERVHGERHPELADLLRVFVQLSEDLIPHLQKEEQVLFPNILTGRGKMMVGPVQVMEAEHQAAGELMRELRDLTGDYRPPEDACGSYRALFEGLEALERALMDHIHLENNILFPRALG